MLVSRIRRNQSNITSRSEATQTIVFTFTQSNIFRNNTPAVGFWGLGDSIRGILSIYQFCKRNQRKFLINIDDHPFSQYLEKDTTPYHCNNAYSMTHFVGGDGGGFNSIKINKKDNIYYVYSNAWPREPLLRDEKSLIRSILTIKREYHIKLPESYSVLHIRTGDEYIKSNLPDVKLAFYVGLVKKYMGSGKIVLCSDNVQLKRHIATTMPDVTVFVNDARSGHVGYDTDPGILRNTLTDLQIVMGARNVYTYSVYPWVSGFVHWVTKCFDIPLISMKGTASGK